MPLCTVPSAGHRRPQLTVLLALLPISGFALAVTTPPAIAAEPERKHALSLAGAPRMPSDFRHFDWTRSDAPKGGAIKLTARGTFDTLNPFNIKGNKPAGLGMIYEGLMQSNLDEASTAYCLVCEWVSHPADFSSVTFELRPAARFSDGRPVTPEDLVFSMQALKKAHPQYRLYFKNVVRGEQTGPHRVTFHFDVKGNRELPYIVGELPVLPKHFWTAKNAKGEARDLGTTTLESPIGLGPYKVKSFDVGRYIAYERITDWWAKDLPVTKGMWNFDEVRYDFYRDQAPMFEAFKAGDADYFQENSAKQWATAYDIGPVRKGLIRKEAITVEGRRHMQAFAMNLRRRQFKDPRVRRALILAFDFEWANRNLFFDQYTRVTNYFGEKSLSSGGLPNGPELEILETVRSDIPAEVFTKPYTLPVNNDARIARRHMAEAAKLLASAGWKAKDGVLANAAGEKLKIEFLITDPAFERIVQPYCNQLIMLGIEAGVRVVDAAQGQRREDDFDYDVIVETFGQSASPGNEQREYWGSAAAAIKGSRNKLGIADPAIDKLIDRVIFAKDRNELEAATRALDRVLLWGHYVVPQWYSASSRLAYWDKFSRPAKLPSRSAAFMQVWWYDEAKAKALAAARQRM